LSLNDASQLICSVAVAWVVVTESLFRVWEKKVAVRRMDSLSSTA